MTSNQKKVLKQFFLFSIFFVITCFFSLVQFAVQGKEFMIRYDSIAEYLTVLIYWGQALRDFFHNLFINHQFVLPQWDFSIGLGADILTTMHWYIIGEPLNLLAVFFKPEKTIYLYNFLLFARLYLSGIAFLIFCNYKKYDKFYSVLCAIAYIFCGWIFFVGIRHIYFVTPMIYLPLLFLGIEMILEDKKPFVFIASVAVACVSNFYFFYILTFLCFIYAIVRFFGIFRQDLLKNFFLYAGKTALFYIIGVLIAATVFFPNVATFLLTSRSDFKIPVPLFYEAKYYLIMFFSLIAPKMIYAYTLLGFSAFIIPVLVLGVYKREKVYRPYLILFAIFMIFMIFPYFGHAFNGFNYLTNRWCFAVSFVSAVLITTNIEKLCTLDKKSLRISLGLSFLLGLSVILLSVVSSKFKETFLISYISLIIITAGIFAINKIKLNEVAKKVILSSLMIFSVAANANLRYSKNGYNFLIEFLDKGTPNQLIFDTIEPNFSKLFPEDSDFFRYEEQNRTLLNNSVLFGTHANQFYWSENSDEIMSFLRELGVTNSGNQKLTSLGNRSYILALLNTKYIFLKEDSPAPYGFEEFKRFEISGKKTVIYKNKNYLPFGTTYKKVISEKDFLKLNFAERSEALLEYAIVSASDETKLQNSFDFSSVETKTIQRNNFTVYFDPTIEQHGNDFTVKKAGSKIHIEFDAVPDAENYLLINNIVYNKNYDDCDAPVYLNGKKIKTLGLDPTYWLWGHNHLQILNDIKETGNILEIEFETKGNYTIDELAVISQKTEKLSETVKELSKEKLENIKFSPNHITGTINVSEPKILCLPIPFSKGWKAYINGKEADLLNIQVLYSGLALKPGNYTIELEYRTPFLRLSFILSLVGLIIFIIMIIVDIRKTKESVKSNGKS